jgi:hypothetical protein
MTLVKSLYSCDPDVIGYNVDVIGLHDRWCYSAYFPDKSMCLAHALGRPCRGPNVVIDDGQVDAPNSQLCRGAEVRALPVTCLSRRLPRG